MLQVKCLSLYLGDFLDDRILLEIATKLGDDWFEILVGLGMSVMELKGLDMTRHNEANLLVSYWNYKTKHQSSCQLFEKNDGAVQFVYGR